jgi:hexosaminidase
MLSLTATLCVAQQPVNIIPQPVSIQQQPGNFILTGNTAIHYNPQQKGLKKVVEFFNLQIRNTTGFVLPVNTIKTTSIQLSIEKLAPIGDEGYNLYYKHCPPSVPTQYLKSPA